MSFGGLNGYVPPNRIWFSGSCVTKSSNIWFSSRDFHMFKTSKFIIPSWKGCIFGTVIFNRVWTLAVCDIKTPFITDTVGTLSLCPHQLDSVIEGVQSNAPSLLFFSARVSLGCLHDLNACWLVTCLFVPGTWLLSVVIGGSVTAGCP